MGEKRTGWSPTLDQPEPYQNGLLRETRGNTDSLLSREEPGFATRGTGLAKLLLVIIYLLYSRTSDLLGMFVPGS